MKLAPKAGTLVIECLRPPTLPTLRERLRDRERPIHVLHFDGHGTFSDVAGLGSGLRLKGGARGQLAFEDDAGRMNLVAADDLAQVLQTSGVRLVVLTACQSARGAADDVFSSVAARLIQGGVDAVAAMSASVLVVSAARYVEGFYRALAGGAPAALAHERARQALHDDPRRHPLRRRKDEEGSPIELRDWWLPHFYQQRQLTLHAAGGGATVPAPPKPRWSDEWLAPPRYGFSGRARELFAIERALVRRQIVVLHGFGGSGKTALACEAGEWLVRTRRYDAGLFMPFERGGDAVALLSQLAHLLDAYDASFDPRETRQAVERLKPELARLRTVVLVDNFETLLPGGEAPLDAGAHAELAEVLAGLAEAGAGVIVTTRDTSFGDARLMPGPRTRHIRLAGLHPEDAYALATRLLDALAIDRARAPYPELRDLLAQLDHHPLALLLVLPALQARDLSVAAITKDFAKLLPKFADDTATGRNRSLLASLDFSLRRLTAAQREWLQRLAVFEGGASENLLLAITGIPEAEWARLRPALEQAALLVAEAAHADVRVPFLRFHPVLCPSLRTSAGARNPELLDRYLARYRDMATFLYDADKRMPQMARALFLRERPNLRRTLAVLLDRGEFDEAVDQLDSTAHFLTTLCLDRELETLRQQLAAAMAKHSGATDPGLLARSEYLQASALGESALERGDYDAAQKHFTSLLERLTKQPPGTPLGPGSFEHGLTLQRLARCLRASGQPGAAAERLNAALAVIDVLCATEAATRDLRRARATMLTDLGDVLLDQGQYPRARQAYAEALGITEAVGDLRGHAILRGQLGTLALREHDVDNARQSYTEALSFFRDLGEPASQANYLHQLGRVAQEQGLWEEAERHYRDSLAIRETENDAVGAAMACNQLANTARRAGHPEQAEQWYAHALRFRNLPTAHSARVRHNLAALLLEEVRAGHTPALRITEARTHAEEALHALETLGLSEEPWKTLNVLAEIADLEHQAEKARVYRRRERATFAAFDGNRRSIDTHSVPSLVVAVAAEAVAYPAARGEVDGMLAGAEAQGWHVADAVRRIWAGERDWHALAEGIDANSALLVLRILETLEGKGPAAAPDA